MDGWMDGWMDGCISLVIYLVLSSAFCSDRPLSSFRICRRVRWCPILSAAFLRSTAGLRSSFVPLGGFKACLRPLTPNPKPRNAQETQQVRLQRNSWSLRERRTVAGANEGRNERVCGCLRGRCLNLHCPQKCPPRP